MRILIIARPFAITGGVERATDGLVGALVAHGHAVELLVPGPPRRVPGAVTHQLRLPALPAAARAMALALAARARVRQGRWDVVQSHERTIAQDVYRAGEGCHRGYLAALAPRGRTLYHRVTLALERRAFAVSRRVVAIARSGREEIRRWYAVPEERLAVIYNGVDLARFHPRHRDVLGPPARAAAALPPDAPALLFVGSGFERKGLDSALEALPLLGDRRVRLLVAGKGRERPYRELADRLGVRERVAWLGPVADPERWYAAADAVVLPTRYEPFGNVHLEALASGVPVVTSQRAGGAELVEGGVNGMAVDPRDASAVARAVERMLALPPAQVRAAARASAEPFTHHAQAEAFTRLYGSLSPAARRNP